MTRFLPLSLRYAITRWQVRRLTRHVDRQIASARRKHKAVSHLQAAKTAIIHDALGASR